MWERMTIQSTCIVYVNSTGMYRCTVEEKRYYFEVAGKTSSATFFVSLICKCRS